MKYLVLTVISLLYMSVYALESIPKSEAVNRYIEIKDNPAKDHHESSRMKESGSHEIPLDSFNYKTKDSSNFGLSDAPVTISIEENSKHNDATSDNIEEKSKHILMFHPWGTKSHCGQLKALLLGLLEKGNKVTGMFPCKMNVNKEGFEEIIVNDSSLKGFNDILKAATSMMLKKDGTNILNTLQYWQSIGPAFLELFETLNELYKNVIDFIEEKNLKVDALIVTGHFFYNGIYLQKKYNSPVILINPIGHLPHVSKLFGNIESPSFQPKIELGYVEPMSFLQRLANTLLYGLMDATYRYHPYQKIGINSNELDELFNGYSLLLLCSHFVTHGAQPYAPNTIEVGGIHCKDGRPLPDDLQTFMDNSPEGVVYVSFGSAVDPSEMSPERKQVFLETFRQLRTPVIWKWNEDTIPELPPNVKLSKWLPQQDLLAHPNLKVFVTHGGLLSLQEAIYHLVPLVGIPLGTDQKPNLLRAQKRGYAIMLDWPTLDTEGFLAAISTALGSEEMKNNMEVAHNLFVDEKESPQERAVWWVEYVVRHQGAHFLKPHSVSLTWYQYYLLDVIGFIILVLLMAVFVAVKCCLCCKNVCCKSRGKTKEE